MQQKTDLQTLERGIRINNILTTALLVVFVIGLGSFIYYCYRQYEVMMEPETIVNMVESEFENNYPQLKKTIKEELEVNAPKLAKQISRNTVKSMPRARKEIEAFALRQFHRGMDKATDFSADRFRQLLRENREFVQEGFSELKQAPKEAEQYVLDLEKQIDRNLGLDIRQDAHNLLRLHIALNDKLQRLTNDTALLKPEELLERRILRILRTLQVRKFPTIEIVDLKIPR